MKATELLGHIAYVGLGGIIIYSFAGLFPFFDCGYQMISLSCSLFPFDNPTLYSINLAIWLAFALWWFLLIIDNKDTGVN